MKKLMFAVAALTAGICVADVQSANVVGYSSDTKFTLSTGAKIITPFFLSVDKDKQIRLSDIKVTGYEDDPGDTAGDITINKLNESGRTIQVDDGEGGLIDLKYCWYDTPGGMFEDPKPAGWYDANEAPLKNGESPLGNADEILITAGDSFWAYGTGDWQAKFLVSGAVNANKLVMAFPLSTGAKALGNALAAKRMLSDFYVTGYEEDPGDTAGDITINKLNESGRTIQVDDGEGGLIDLKYCWYDTPGGMFEDPKPAGWYDANEAPLKNGESPLGNADEIEIAPGEGFWAYGTGDWQAYLNVNKLELDK